MNSSYHIRDEIFDQHLDKISNQGMVNTSTNIVIGFGGIEPTPVTPTRPIKATGHTTHTAAKVATSPKAPFLPAVKSKKKRDGPTSLRKAPGAPKRFKSSYILFFMEKQKEIKAELGEKASVGEISKRSSEKWKNLSPKEREIWDMKAEADKERFYLEKQHYKGPWQVPWKRAKKNPNAPKRPMSAFLFFSQDKRRLIKEANPGMRNTEVSRVLGGMWKKASAEERSPHIEREAAEREKYKIEIAKWREEEAIRSQEAANEEKSIKIESPPEDESRIQLEPRPQPQPHHQPQPQPHPQSHSQGPPAFRYKEESMPERDSPLPIHQPPHTNSPIPTSPSQNYYPQGRHGDHYYHPQNYSAPTTYNSYGSYQQQQQQQHQPSPPPPQGQNYYQNYAPVSHSDYRPRRYQEYHDYPPPNSVDSLDDMRHKSHSLNSPPPAQYGSYYNTSISGYSVDQQHQQHLQQQPYTTINYSDEYTPVLFKSEHNH